MTHGGDGLFLWAGQTTMDTGEGGANDNLFYRNDFSFAPTNGMEATFSRNTFIGNLIEGSDHGLWGGYSFDSKVIGNDFRRNRVGIAIEHGQANAISYNRFAGDSTAIYLWANPIEPSDWGYPKHRNTQSRNYRISENIFFAPRVGVRASATHEMRLTGNRAIGVDSLYVLADTSQWTIADERDADDTTRESGRAARLAGFDMVPIPALPPEFERLAPPKMPAVADRAQHANAEQTQRRRFGYRCRGVIRRDCGELCIPIGRQLIVWVH